MQPTTLNGAIDNAQTSLIVHDVVSHSVPFDACIGDEILNVTNISSHTWTVARGQERTSKAAHLDNALIYEVVQKDDLPNSLIAHLTDINGVIERGISFISNGSSIQTATVVLSPEQILALATTPVSVTPTPAATQYHVPILVVMTFTAGASAYVAPASITILSSLAGVQWVGAVGSDVLGGGANANSTVSATVNGGYVADHPLTDKLGSALFISANANPTTGNGTLQVDVAYYVVTV